MFRESCLPTFDELAPGRLLVLLLPGGGAELGFRIRRGDPLLFGDAPGLSPPARFYQRLIAGDQDQAWSVLRPEIEVKALHEVYDSVVLPALSMAEHDSQRGALDDEADARIEETMKLLLEEAGELRTDSHAGRAP